MRLLHFVWQIRSRHRCRALRHLAHSTWWIPACFRARCHGLAPAAARRIAAASTALALRSDRAHGARARARGGGERFHENLLAIYRFFEEAACALARAIATTGHAASPVAHRSAICSAWPTARASSTAGPSGGAARQADVGAMRAAILAVRHTSRRRRQGSAGSHAHGHASASVDHVPLGLIVPEQIRASRPRPDA